MNVSDVERLDHHGIVASVIDELGLVELIDNMLPSHDQEKVSVGECVKAMIITGLGFTDVPMTLTPDFFKTTGVSRFFGDGFEAADFNRFKFGRALDKVFQLGCENVFALAATDVCRKEGIDTTVGHLDTTTLSVTGEYLPDNAETEVKFTYGYSKDYRADLKQITLELMVSRDGGIPFWSHLWDGNASDNAVFQSRCEEIQKGLHEGISPDIIIADSKLYSLNNSDNLSKISFLTRIPETIKACKELIQEAFDDAKSGQNWQMLDSEKMYKEFKQVHYNIQQRWLVVRSQASIHKAEESVKKALEKETTEVKKKVFHMEAQEFDNLEQAKKELDRLNKKLRYTQLLIHEQVEVKKYNKRGRPAPDDIPEDIKIKVKIKFQALEEKITAAIQQKSCYVLGTNSCSDKFPPKNIINTYTEQYKVEKSFRFLKGSEFFTSAFFIKKPSRVMALTCIMSLSLLIYAVAERKLRDKLKELDESVPDMLGKPTQTPTLRWVFKLLSGISLVSIDINGEIKKVLHGIDELKIKIIGFFGERAMKIYSET